MAVYALFLLVVICLSLLCVGCYEPFQSKAQKKHLQDAINETKLRYHPAEDQIKEMYGFTQEYTEIRDDAGNLKQIPQHATQGKLLYYQPGSKPYEHYEMDYTDAIMFANQ